MRLHVLRNRPTPVKLQDMLGAQGAYIKLAVDIERGVIAGVGEYHADCEELLLEDGSLQENIWGADWDPESHSVTFGALINIRPRQQNREMEIADPVLRGRVERVVRRIFEGGTS